MTLTGIKYERHKKFKRQGIFTNDKKFIRSPCCCFFFSAVSEWIFHTNHFAMEWKRDRQYDKIDKTWCWSWHLYLKCLFSHCLIGGWNIRIIWNISMLSVESYHVWSDGKMVRAQSPGALNSRESIIVLSIYFRWKHGIVSARNRVVVSCNKTFDKLSFISTWLDSLNSDPRHISPSRYNSWLFIEYCVYTTCITRTLRLWIWSECMNLWVNSLIYMPI